MRKCSWKRLRLPALKRNAPRLQLLVKSVPEDDAIYLGEDRRYGGKAGDTEDGSLAPLSPAGRLDAAVPLDESPQADIGASERQFLSVRSVEIGSRRLRTLRLRQPGGRCAKHYTSHVTAERFVLDNPTLPQLLGG